MKYDFRRFLRDESSELNVDGLNGDTSLDPGAYACLSELLYLRSRCQQVSGTPSARIQYLEMLRHMAAASQEELLASPNWTEGSFFGFTLPGGVLEFCAPVDGPSATFG